MTERYVVEVDSSDPPLPRLIGPFASRRAATTWMAEQPLTAAEWNVAPLHDPQPPACITVHTAPADSGFAAGLRIGYQEGRRP